MQSTAKSKNVLHLVQLSFAFVGLVASLYLLIQHTRLKSGIQEGASFCTLGAYADCDVVNSSALSEIAGVPIAALGALFYFLCLILGLLAFPQSKNFSRAQQGISWLALTAVVIDAALLMVQIFSLHTLCLVCCFTYLCTLGMLFIAVSMVGGETRGLVARLKTALFGNSGPKPPVPGSLIFLSLLALVSFAIGLYLLPSYIRIKSQNYAVVDNALTQFFRDWQEKKVRRIEIKKGDGVVGNPAAKIQMVAFSDFQCPHCRRAAFTLHTVLEPLKDLVHFTFKNFPLDSTCNPQMQYQLHPQACALARLAYCSEQKGKFWEFHDLVFLKMSNEDVEKGIDVLAQEFTSIFSPEEIAACLKSEKALRNITENIKLGAELGVAGTPTLYINGKHVSIPLTPENIKRLIQIEESQAH